MYLMASPAFLVRSSSLLYWMGCKVMLVVICLFVFFNVLDGMLLTIPCLFVCSIVLDELLGDADISLFVCLF